MTQNASPVFSGSNSLKQYALSREPVIGKNAQFMFFANLKVCKKSIAWDHLKNRAVMLREKNEKKYLSLFNRCFENIEKVFKFTVVRNPWDRVVSTFFYLQQIRRYHYKIDKKETFKNFVKTQLKEKGHKINIHFHPQYLNTHYNNIIYVDFVARFENLKEDWEKISRKIKVDKNLPHVNASMHDHYTLYYDSDCINIISNIYKKDIETFEYSYD